MNVGKDDLYEKMISLMLAAVMLLSLTAVSFAFPMVSPTQGGTPAIRLVDTNFLDKNGDPVKGEEFKDCQAKLVITPYRDKDKAETVIHDSLVVAYTSYLEDFDTDARAMLNAADTTNIVNKYPGYDLRVVNIFDITVLCDTVHNNDYEELIEYHGNHWVRLALNDEDAQNFVALLHYKDADHDYSTDNGEWEVIPTQKIGNEILFQVQCGNLSPFAIIARTRVGGEDDPGHGGRGGHGDSIVSPQTYDMSAVMYASGALFLATMGTAVLYKGKKRV